MIRRDFDFKANLGRILNIFGIKNTKQSEITPKKIIECDKTINLCRTQDKKNKLETVIVNDTSGKECILPAELYWNPEATTVPAETSVFSYPIDLYTPSLVNRLGKKGLEKINLKDENCPIKLKMVSCLPAHDYSEGPRYLVDVVKTGRQQGVDAYILLEYNGEIYSILYTNEPKR